jgi:cell division cycle 14
MRLGWYSFKTFDDKEYEYYENHKNGDISWIIPGKFIAFMGPETPSPFNSSICNAPDDYLEVFKHFGVSRVIRLNEPKYEASTFTSAGIGHSDLFFLDGSVPPPSIVDRFFEIAEKEKGVIAIHCKAGLGRTGTLIGLYAMKHFKFPAAPFIGWIRIARAGSILGPQQFYLNDVEENYLGRDQAINRNSLPSEKRPEMSKIDKEKMFFGEKNQGEGLVERKYTRDARHSTVAPSTGHRYTLHSMMGSQGR